MALSFDGKDQFKMMSFLDSDTMEALALLPAMDPFEILKAFTKGMGGGFAMFAMVILQLANPEKLPGLLGDLSKLIFDLFGMEDKHIAASEHMEREINARRPSDLPRHSNKPIVE